MGKKGKERVEERMGAVADLGRGAGDGRPSLLTGCIL